jgi:hypothetical protein
MLYVDAAHRIADRRIGLTPAEAGSFVALAPASPQRAQQQFRCVPQNSN